MQPWFCRIAGALAHPSIDSSDPKVATHASAAELAHEGKGVIDGVVDVAHATRLRVPAKVEFVKVEMILKIHLDGMKGAELGVSK